MNHPDMPKLTNLFGSAAEIARITGSSRAAVARWGRYRISEQYQKRLIEASFDRDLDPYEVAHAAGVQQCPVCKAYHLNGKTFLNHHEPRR